MSTSATGIEWTDVTWNPLRGCSRVSPGCERCYAEKIAERFSGPGQPFEGYASRGQGWSRKVSLVVDKLTEPLHWKKPRKIFVNSMSDLFHESVPDEEIAAIFGVMAACPHHIFQVLTKRERRMAQWFAWVAGHGVDPWTECHAAALAADPDNSVHARSEAAPGRPWPLPNVHLGVSVETQEYGNRRIPKLQRCPAAVRWVSVEPLLGSLDLCNLGGPPHPSRIDALHGEEWSADGDHFHPPALDWVVVGGESGQGARTFEIEWARSIRDACAEAGVPFFMKQLGRRPNDAPIVEERGHGLHPIRLADPHGGDMEEWPPDLRVRQWPIERISAAGDGGDDGPLVAAAAKRAAIQAQAQAMADRLTRATGVKHEVRKPLADPRFPDGPPWSVP